MDEKRKKNYLTDIKGVDQLAASKVMRVDQLDAGKNKLFFYMIDVSRSSINAKELVKKIYITDIIARGGQLYRMIYVYNIIYNLIDALCNIGS